jgi:type I restriction enzyme S subunit
MSRKTTPTTEEAAPALVSKLRFPEFRKADGWKVTQLQKIARPVSDRAVTGDADNILSLSGEHGLVLQSDYFGKKIAGDSAERYLKLLRNDFVYNDRTTKASTFGTIKRLSKYEGGIVSPIYKCFRFHADENPIFWEWYFESGSHEAALRGLVNEGARAGRFNISISQFLSTAAPRPDEPEQQKIASCLSSVDELIAAQARKLDALKTHKKGLMQQLFPREGETQPRLRFPEFQNAGEWEPKLLGDLVKSFKTGKLDANAMVENGQYRFYTCAKNHYQIDKYAFEGEALLVAGNGAHLGYIHHYIGKFNAYQRTYVLQKFEANVVFLRCLLDRYLPSRIQFEKKDGNTPYIVLSTLTEMPLVIPKDAAEQERIASCLTSLDDLITAQTQKLEALKTHKKGLMQQLFPSPEEVEV